MPENYKYTFIDKSLFFPKQGILVIGDLHIGYEAMLRQSGVLIPERQVKDMINELKEIFDKIKQQNQELRKIVFIGDIKHAFTFEHEEKNEFREVIEFLGNYLPQENIILIKGNHDTIDYTFEGKMKYYHIEGNIAFIHGDEYFKEAFNKDIELIVMGHIHPSVMLTENPGVKKETYKCFLEGVFKRKKVIILPSFLGFFEGTPVNELESYYEDYFSIIPRKDLLNFKIHIIGKDQVYNFGKIKDLVKS